MKTKFKFLLVTCVIAAVAITGFNFVQNGSNIDVSLADIAVMARADGESGGTACVDTYFHADNYVQSEGESICRLSDGTKCGIQKGCEYQVGAGDCQETTCQGHTSG